MIPVTSQQAAEFFEVHQSTLTRWKHLGAKGYISRGKWDLQALFRWWQSNIQADRSGDTGLSEARRRYWQSKAELGELKAAEMRGELIPIAEIEKKWASRVAAVCAMMELLAARLPGLLAGKSRREMAKIIENEVWSIRDAYASQGVR
ncbi:MAG: hypothetical protein JRI83_12115 [Deltaproteobacteria bacterium]|nr:hypothetical protein [Deltaproteobacteria bacterium]